MRSLSFFGLALTLVLALLGARIFLSLGRWGPSRAALAVAGVGLGLALLLFVAAVLATTIEDTGIGWLDSVFWFGLLATPVAVVVFASVRLAEELPLPRPAADAAGAALGAALALVVSSPGAEWLDEPPPARYARIDEVRGAYGPVALGTFVQRSSLRSVPRSARASTSR